MITNMKMSLYVRQKKALVCHLSIKYICELNLNLRLIFRIITYLNCLHMMVASVYASVISYCLLNKFFRESLALHYRQAKLVLLPRNTFWKFPQMIKYRLQNTVSFIFRQISMNVSVSHALTVEHVRIYQEISIALVLQNSLDSIVKKVKQSFVNECNMYKFIIHDVYWHWKAKPFYIWKETYLQCQGWKY